MPELAYGTRFCRAAVFAALTPLLIACGPGNEEPGTAASAASQYPATERGDQVDDYHGTTVADPYRWFEDYESTATNAWITAENALSRPYLDSLPTRAHFARRLAELYDYERFSVPEQSGGRYVYSYNSGTENSDWLLHVSYLLT